MHPSILSGLCSLLLTSAAFSQATYPIVDTAQNRAYGERGEISYPKSGDQFYGQDAQYAGAHPSYKVNGDGTVSDNVTGDYQRSRNFKALSTTPIARHHRFGRDRPDL